MILVLTGVDGSGKTTIAKELTKRLTARGYKVRLVWVKSLHTLAFLIYIFYRRIWGTEYIINPTRRIVEHYCTEWMKKLKALWAFIEFISVTPWIIIVYLYNLMGYLVICDRFLIDFLTTVALRIKDALWPWKSIIGKLIMKIQSRIPTIHLRISLPTLLSRKPNIEYTLNELPYLITLYHLIAKYTNAQETPNENKPPKTIVQNIMRYLLIHCKQR